MQRLSMTMGLAFLCSLAACGGESKSAGKDSPKAVAEALIASFAAGDAEAAAALLPPVDAVRKALECEDDELAKRIEKRRARVGKEIAEMKAENVTIALAAFDKEGSETKTFASGEEFKGCKVLAPVTVHESKITLMITEKGKADEDGETWGFVRFGDDKNWYWMK